MIHVKSILHWFQLAFISGTYPILPWMAFYFIGSNLDGNKINEKWSPHLLRSGSLAFCTLLATLAISITQEMNWAETMGEGVLTFFPANHWFVIVSASWNVPSVTDASALTLDKLPAVIAVVAMDLKVSI